MNIPVWPKKAARGSRLANGGTTFVNTYDAGHLKLAAAIEECSLNFVRRQSLPAVGAFAGSKELPCSTIIHRFAHALVARRKVQGHEHDSRGQPAGRGFRISETERRAKYAPSFVARIWAFDLREYPITHSKTL
jgi:hypothetical protein